MSESGNEWMEVIKGTNGNEHETKTQVALALCEFLYPPTSTSPHLNYLRNCTVSEVIRWADAVCVSGCTTLVELSVATDSHLPGPPTVQRGEFYRWKSRSKVRGLCHEQALRFRCPTMLFSNEGSALTDF